MLAVIFILRIINPSQKEYRKTLKLIRTLTQNGLNFHIEKINSFCLYLFVCIFLLARFIHHLYLTILNYLILDPRSVERLLLNVLFKVQIATLMVACHRKLAHPTYCIKYIRKFSRVSEGEQIIYNSESYKHYVHRPQKQCFRHFCKLALSVQCCRRIFSQVRKILKKTLLNNTSFCEFLTSLRYVSVCFSVNQKKHTNLIENVLVNLHFLN